MEEVGFSGFIDFDLRLAGSTIRDGDEEAGGGLPSEVSESGERAESIGRSSTRGSEGNLSQAHGFGFVHAIDCGSDEIRVTLKKL